MHAVDLQDLNEAPADGGAKRRQIMEGARAEFLKSGFDGTSMNDIARTAGVSKGTLYVYFPSKEHLFEALIREEKRQQAERLCGFLVDTGHPHTDLMNFGLNLVKMMCTPEKQAQVRTVIAICGRFPQLGRAFFESGPLHGAEQLAAYFAEQTRSGALDVDDTMMAAWQFLNLCQAGVYKRVLFGMVEEVEETDIVASVEAAVRVFMAAYGPKAAS